jgi:heme/copper-type cytochrome/quinol oxidase subunit 2
MTINWGAFGIVAVASLAVVMVVVVLVSLALVGLSARADPAEEPQAIGRARYGLTPAAGTAMATLCLVAASAIVLYGFYLLIF